MAVETALGVPETKVDLSEKVLYKYKNMTAEFNDGKVNDVR
jgi:ACT domain-containing protein